MAGADDDDADDDASLAAGADGGGVAALVAGDDDDAGVHADDYHDYGDDFGDDKFLLHHGLNYYIAVADGDR